MIKSYKIRLFPTPKQEALMWQHIGSCRYIWNYMLDLQQKRYESGEKHLSAFSMINLLKPLKNDGGHEWLYGVSNMSLSRTCQDLDRAHASFFKKTSRYPKFKSRKKSKPNFPVRESIYFKDGMAVIEKVGKVPYRTNYDLPQGKGFKLSNPRVSYQPNGIWMLSFGIEHENQAFELTDKAMGIDLGVKETAIVSFGSDSLVFHNINKSKRIRQLERRLKHEQRNLARKKKGSNNRDRAKQKVQRTYAKLADVRKDYTHKTTHTLVSLLPYAVVMEDLNISGMMKNRHLSRAIAQQNFAEFIRQMRYKCEWRGIEFVQVSRFYPSSKTCSNCGTVKPDLKLSDRMYICPECGFEIDRDLNAAINLMKYAELQREPAA